MVKVIHLMYDQAMQIAIVLEDDQVEQLDGLVPEEFPSRAAAVRTAVETWLSQRRSARIDQQYEASYAASPPEADDIDSSRIRKDSALPAGWEDLDW